MPRHEKVLENTELPAAYSAWILFRSLCNLLELNDFLAFGLMALRYGLTAR